MKALPDGVQAFSPYSNNVAFLSDLRGEYNELAQYLLKTSRAAVWTQNSEQVFCINKTVGI
jgi:hypothetical protein